MSTWELIGVIPNLSNAQGRVLDGNFELKQNLTVGPIPSWVKKDRILDNLPWPDRSLIENSNYSFRFLYESKGIGSKKRKAEELLKYASLALWLTNPTPCGINVYLHFDCPDGKGIQRSATWGDQLLSHKKDSQNILTQDDLLRAKNLLEKLILIPKKQCTMRTSINLLWRALIDPWWESRYLSMWVALEAIYGPDHAQEITFRISYRCMAFLSKNKNEAHQLFKMIKEGYKWRSKVVHGRQLKKLTTEASEKISHDTESVLRRSFNKIFSSADYISIFNSAKRDKYLDELLIEAPWK